MSINHFTAPKDVARFLHDVTQKKKTCHEWACLHVGLNPDANVGLDEIIQFLNFRFQKSETAILQFPRTREILMITHNSSNEALGLFDQAIYENFSSDQVRSSTNPFNKTALELFAKILTPLIPAGNKAARVGLTRFNRTTNTIMVMDDDPMVLKQMENVMRGFGHVVLVEKPDEFLESYEQYAPDVLFLDIHLPSAHGPDLLKTLRETIDPFAHTIMISSDSMKQTLMQVKQSGAKGFVLKPFNRDALFKRVMQAPTFIPRTAQF